MRNKKHQQGSFWIMFSIVLILVAAIALVLSPMAENVQDLASHFGWKSSKQYKKELRESGFAIDAAVKVNEDLDKKVDNQAKSNDAVVEAVDVKHKTDTVIEKKVDQIKQQQKQQVDQIKTKYKDLPKSPTIDKAIDRDIAETQIASLWQTYCSFNTHKECTVNTI